MGKGLIFGAVVDVTGEDTLIYTDTCKYMRETRDALLIETDAWALSDRTMSDAQTAYRQALRDVTGQAGFPEDITWPTKPS